jgi:hypothetical protein
MAANAETASSSNLLTRLSPLFAGFLAAITALVAATLRGLPLPLDVAGVFLILGIATTWIARRTPLRGVLFVAVLAIAVIAVVYAA